MRVFLLTLPAALSALVLGAHYLRRGALVPVALCLVLAGLLVVRRWWVARLAQLALLFAAFQWLQTLAVLAPARRAAGEPATRLVVILASVALVAALSALAFELPVLKRHFGIPMRPPDPTP